MQSDNRDVLAKIKNFDQLVGYLRDKMGWPIVTDDLEELTFDYTPEELGIDVKNAAMIESIKRLRPLSSHQPWGIFFVEFERKRLPVVALRRILSRVTLKKRASANSAERTAWAANDLLFVSNYGEGDERTITFAHFAYDETKQDLPVLKVLGWNDEDTALHLDGVAYQLISKLAWPTDEEDAETWRKQWRSAFTLRHREEILTSKDLSVRLARLAQTIRKRINIALAIETEQGPLKKLMKAFQDALIHDLDADGFADMYAQTIAYGLLSARIVNPNGGTADELHIQVPVTNPFLKELMETFLYIGGRHGNAGGPGIDFDELGVSEVVEMLNEAKMGAVIRDFGDKNPQEDPVIHFYELFLKEYDPRKRLQRGVFYTPRPVVSYIVHSVDELLRTEFGLQDGLADTTTWSEMAKRHKDLKILEGTSPDQVFVQILDPATGTGTFLVETIDLIHCTMRAKWKEQGLCEKEIEALWNKYVPKYLLPRLHGFELLMAPYAIAHLKVGLKLYETGYDFNSEERTRIYLTNTLEPASDAGQLTLTNIYKAIAHEAQAVNKIKRKQQFTVIIGNPPYSGVSANMQPVMRKIIDPYRFVNGQPIKEKGALQFEKNLNDDYVKFLRFAESQVESASGIIGMITNNAYLESATLRGLRAHLLGTFSRLHFLDLHGDIDKRETTDDGQPDENVFDIKHGVAVAMLVRMPFNAVSERRKGESYRFDLKASRQLKYQWLLTHTAKSIKWTTLNPRPNRYLLKTENSEVAEEYESYISVSDLLGVNSTGFESGRDEVLTAFAREELRSKLHTFCTDSAQVVKSKFAVEKGWGARLFEARGEIVKDPAFNSRFRQFLFSPFDIRWCFYRKDMLKTNSFSAGKHLCYGSNIALIVMRQVSLDSGFSHVGISKYIVNNRCFYSTKGKVSYFPIFLYSGESDLIRYKGSLLGSNLSTDYLARYAQSLQLKWIPGEPNCSSSVDIMTSMDMLNYSYAVFHSEGYRVRYAEFLKVDFPRLPLCHRVELFRTLARIGGELVSLHLMESPKLDKHITKFIDGKNPEVEKVTYSDETVWIDKAKTKGFNSVPEAVWNFQIGGYQVCEKWLKDRKGRTLSKDDLIHYQKIVVALAETIHLMHEIDEVIEQHGGWPGAFHTNEEITTKPQKELLDF